MPDKKGREDKTPEKATWPNYLGIVAATLLGLVAVEEAATKLISGAPALWSAIRSIYDRQPENSQWREALVNLKGGGAPLRDGYELRNIQIKHLGPSPHRHHFSFDIYGPNGQVRTGVSYVGDNDAPWRKSLVDFDNHTLEFGFSNWNEGSGKLHFSWR